MNKSDVQSRVVEYFEENGYYTLKEFKPANEKPKIDVIAFKWLDEYDLGVIAVECKGDVGFHDLVNTAYSQLREYQAGFPTVYLAVPENIDMPGLKKYLASLESVNSYHDLHVWAISTTITALSVHLVVKSNKLDNQLLTDIQQHLNDHFSIEHATIQVEQADSKLSSQDPDCH